MSLEQILCFKQRRKVSRDNTVKYKQHTLQLLPDESCPSYAGIQVEVQEDLDGRLLVQYQGETIPTQGAPKRPSQLRKAAAVPPDCPRSYSGINGNVCPIDSYLTTLETVELDRDLRPRKSKAQQNFIPTPGRRPPGRTCSRPSSETCHCEPWPVSSASSETPCAGMLWQTALQ